eukprot:scaffold39498_cov56-Attheya_sp.AAC.1
MDRQSDHGNREGAGAGAGLLPRVALYKKRYLVLLYYLPKETTTRTMQVPALRLDQVARFVLCQTTTARNPHNPPNNEKTHDTSRSDKNSDNDDMPNSIPVVNDLEFEYLTLTIPPRLDCLAGDANEYNDLFLFPYQNLQTDDENVPPPAPMEAFVDPAASIPLVVQAPHPHDICILDAQYQQPPLLLHVTDTGGCWVGDFLGIGGLHQIWILPRILMTTTTTGTGTTTGSSTGMDPDASSPEPVDDSSKRLLQHMVQHSIWTDGVHIYPSSGDHSISHDSSSTTRTQQTRIIHDDITIQVPRIVSTRIRHLPNKNPPTLATSTSSVVVVSADRHCGSLNRKRPRPTGTIGVCAALEPPFSDHDTNTRPKNDTAVIVVGRDNHDRMDDSSSHSNHWSHKVVQGLEAQWRHSQEARDSRERATAQQEGWIRTSRSLLHRMTHHDESSSCSSDRRHGGFVELVRLRYSTRPNTNHHTMGTTGSGGGGDAQLGLSCVVCMELDIVYRHGSSSSSSSSRGGGEEGATTNHEMDSTTGTTTVPTSSSSRTNPGNDDGNEDDGDHGLAASTEHRQHRPQRKQESGHTDNEDEDGSIGMAQQVHISCAFVNPNNMEDGNHSSTTGGTKHNNHGSHHASKPTNNVVVRTQSGVVPHLVPDTCVTIVVLVDVNHIPVVSSPKKQYKHNPDERNDSFPIALAIHAMWTTTTTSSSPSLLSRDEDENNHNKRVGMPLAILYLPLEVTILQHNHNHFVIDYNTSTLSSQPQEQRNGRRCGVVTSQMKSRAMYECRHARVLTLDISNVPSLGRDRRQEQQWWKQDLVTSLNRASTSNRIDVQYDDDDDRDQRIIKLLIFSCTPQERLGKYLLTLECPNNYRTNLHWLRQLRG